MPQNAEFQYSILIREDHLDTFGHVNNATYLSLFEEARWELITQNGYGLQKVVATGLGPTILEINLKFKRELRLREKITIHSQVIEYKGKVGRLRQWISNAQGDICTELEMKIGLFSLAERKLVNPTPDWMRAITEVR